MFVPWFPYANYGRSAALMNVKIITDEHFLRQPWSDVAQCYTTLMLLSKAKTDFLEYLEIEQNRSQKTIENYDHYLTRLLDFAGDVQITEITPELVRKWRLWLNRLGTNTSDELQRSTANYHLIALRSFLKFCAKRDIAALPADKIEL